MVHSVIDVVFGVFVTWGDLIKLGYVKSDELEASDCYMVELPGDAKLVVFYAHHHSYVTHLNKVYPERLPKNFKARPDENYSLNEPDNSDLVCVGVKAGTIEISRGYHDIFPTLEEMIEAEMEFEDKIPQVIRDVAGVARLQYIPNDCCCCT